MIHAIVTGHSQGLGQALAAELLARGARVLGLARHGQAELALAAGGGVGCEPGPNLGGNLSGTLTQVSLDLSDSARLGQWLQGPELAQWLQGASTVLLLNNAGQLQPVAPPGRQGAAAIAAAVALNVAAPLMLADAVVRARPPAAQCRIAHISSGAGRNPYAGWSVYCATKAALDMHARAAQQDAVPGVRVASVAPGVVDTAMQVAIRATAQADFPLRSRFEALHRDGQLATPAEVAPRLLDHVLSATFGAEPVVDLRLL